MTFTNISDNAFIAWVCILPFFHMLKLIELGEIFSLWRSLMNDKVSKSVPIDVWSNVSDVFLDQVRRIDHTWNEWSDRVKCLQKNGKREDLFVRRRFVVISVSIFEHRSSWSKWLSPQIFPCVIFDTDFGLGMWPSPL